MPTFAGFHSNFEITKYPVNIRAALRRIADNFYITKSFDAEKVGNSSYYAALVRPTDETSVFLNTERELLIVFSCYKTFEVRTLEAYDIFFSHVESARIDQSIRFLVSEDESIEKSIKHYLEQHPEYPIIVPITFDNLATKINPLIKAIQKNYLIRDLFGFQSPLREEHFFFGRNEIVHQVIDLSKSGQHSSLFGLRKSGKTSTIYAIQRKAKSANLNVIVFDCQNISIHGRTYMDLLVYLTNKIRGHCNLKIVAPPAVMNGPDVAEWFEQHMKATLDSVKSNILLIFDEIENISPGTAASLHWRNGNDSVYFWQVIRSFSQLQKKRKLVVCLVGTSPSLIEQAKINEIDNPAYLLAGKKFIPNLTFDETREMIERLGFFMGLNFSTKIVSALHNAYGGHPFFTRQVCSKIHQLTGLSRPCDIPTERLTDAQQQFSSILEGYLAGIIFNLRELYPEEFRLLRLLVLNNRNEIEEYLEQAPELIDHLIGYGLISRRDGIYEITFEAIKGAVLKLEPEREPILPMEDRWSEIVNRRGRVEQSIRTAIYFSTKSLINEEWEEIINNCISVKRKEFLSSTEPSILLAKGNSPLYLTDLLSLMKDKRIILYLDERRSNILKALHTVNSLRNDAHANDIAYEDFIIVSNALSILEAEFDTP